MKKLSLLSLAMLMLMACNNNSPELPGVFSVDKNRKVQFSPGALQYRASTNTWRFASSQLEMCGENNTNTSATYNGWIDLFGYGASGYNGIMPYETSTNGKDYAPTGDDGITGTEYDWGIHCHIQNGGKKGSWRLPTCDDWYWILGKRENAINLSTIIYVDGSMGLLVLPDGWENTTGLNIHFPKTVIYEATFDMAEQNKFTQAEFKQLENTGAVFLPLLGHRLKSKYSLGTGNYWCSTSIYAGQPAWCLRIFRTGADWWNESKQFGNGVRLIKDVATE